MSRKMRNPPASLGTLVTRSQLMLLFFVLLIMAWNSIWLSSSGFRKIERQDVLTRVQEQVKAAKAKGEKDKERGEENKCTPVVARLSELERYGVESGRAMSGSQLSDFILKALETVPQDTKPLCVMEVGTADGTGTTVQLVNALSKFCGKHGRDWQLVTYEGLTSSFNEAQMHWNEQRNVKVVNELVMTREKLQQFVLPNIEGGEGSEWPSKQFYRNFYQGIDKQIASREVASWFQTRPLCKPDMVLIDSTRFAHLGIIATILDTPGMADERTVFLIENDFWKKEDGHEWVKRTQREIIEKGIYVEAPLGEDHPKGEKWPWLYFRARMKQPSAAAVADPKDREPTLPRPLVRSEPTILGEERKEETRKTQSREEESGGGTKKKSWIQDDANGDGDGSAPPAKKGTCTQVIPSLSLTSELNLFLRKVLKSVPAGSSPVCAVRVGTSEGTSSTDHLVDALNNQCEEKQRDWSLTLFEGLTRIFQDAQWRWQEQGNVKVINELGLSLENLRKYVMRKVEGSEGNEWPSKGFYSNFYADFERQVASKELGRWLQTRPGCKPDVVLIDSTRFGHLGVIVSMLEGEGIADEKTIFIIENDSWEKGDTFKILERHLNLDKIDKEHPKGEQWPWLAFRARPLD